MTIDRKLSGMKTIFIDTAPLIYYIESHPQFGGIVNQIMESLQSEKFYGITSVITLTEVLPKPIERGQKKLAEKFISFLKHGKNLELLEITSNIAEKAGRLRGKYTFLKTFDAIQIATALEGQADAFITNDVSLKKIREIPILVIKDFVKDQ